jgi:anti-sigma F factor
MENSMKITFQSKSINESFARIVACAFAAQLDPTTEEMADIKTAVSEAVTNAIIHGYENDDHQIIEMQGSITEDFIEFVIVDYGRGIENIERAMEPLYTTLPQGERSGMGFTVMESFMDKLSVESEEGHGTKVTMGKKILHT